LLRPEGQAAAFAARPRTTGIALFFRFKAAAVVMGWRRGGVQFGFEIFGQAVAALRHRNRKADIPA